MSFFHCVWISREIAAVRSDSVIVSGLSSGPRRYPSVIALRVAEAIEQRVRRAHVVRRPRRELRDRDR
jgi:hypothetical protein